MIFVNVFLAGLLLMAIIVLLQERAHTRNSLSRKEEQMMHLTKLVVDQQDKINGVQTDSANTMKTSAKIFKMVNRLSHLKKDVADIDHDLAAVKDMIHVLTKAQQQGMKAHNDLTTYVVDNFSEVWCDLCDNDCSCCPFENTCKNWDPKENPNPCMRVNEEGFPSEPMVNNYDAKGVSGTMTIDPSSEEDLDNLVKAMAADGVPVQFLEKYKSTLKKALDSSIGKSEKIDVVWRSEPVSNLPSEPTPMSNPIKAEKMIDPKSKIVKTLNELYNNSK